MEDPTKPNDGLASPNQYNPDKVALWRRFNWWFWSYYAFVAIDILILKAFSVFHLSIWQTIRGYPFILTDPQWIKPLSYLVLCLFILISMLALTITVIVTGEFGNGWDMENGIIGGESTVAIVPLFVYVPPFLLSTNPIYSLIVFVLAYSSFLLVFYKLKKDNTQTPNLPA